MKMTNKNGFREKYRTKDGTGINADPNDSAEKGRNAFPELLLAGSVCLKNEKFSNIPTWMFKRSSKGIHGAICTSVLLLRTRLKRKTLFFTYFCV